jgi:membrane protein implicated in regulation of membrane protease activity
MSVDAALLLVRAIEAYAAAGLLFAVPFAAKWAGRTDPRAAGGTWGFRLLIVPGAVLFWPLLAARLLRGRAEPPDGWTAHRARARAGAAGAEP